MTSRWPFFSRAHQGRGLYVARLAAYVLLQLLLAWLGSVIAPVSANIYALWLPAGLDFAVLFHFGLRYFPGAIIGPLLFSVVSGLSFPLALAYGTATASASVLAVLAARQVCPEPQSPFSQLRTTVLMLGVAAVLPYALGAIAGVTAGQALGANAQVDTLALWRAWWLSDMAAMLTLSPLILSLLQKPELEGDAQVSERLIWAIALLLLSSAVFSSPSIYRGDPTLMYVLFPLIFWPVLRMGAREAFAAVFTINAAAMVGVTHLDMPEGEARSFLLLRLQVAIATLGVMNWVLVAAVTELRRALQARTDAETRFRTAFDKAASGLALVSPDGKFLQVNTAFCTMTGYSDADLLHMTYLQLVHPDEQQESRNNMKAMLSGDMPFLQARKRFIRKDGEMFWALITVTVARDASGRALHFIGQVQDFTSFKRVEEKLMESEQRFRSMARLIPVGICEMDSQRKLIFANDYWLGMIGLSAETASTDAWLAAVHPDDLPALRRQLDELFAQPRAADFSYRLLHGNGREVWVQVRGVPVFDRDGALSAYVTCNEDVTEQRRHEAEILALTQSLEHKADERTAQLQAINDELAAFTYSVSHDLRAPIRAIEGFSRMLIDDEAEALPTHVQGYLQRINTAAERLRELVNAFLLLSRAGSDQLQRIDVDVSTLAAHVVHDMVAGEADEKRINWHIAPGLRAPADPELLRVLLTNLFNNARKFSREQEQPMITFGAERQDGELVYFVEDNGIGFAPEQTPKLFVPFSRLNPSGQFEGTGIGLATCRRIVQRHGGRIWAEGSPGHGARFSFTLQPRHED